MFPQTEEEFKELENEGKTVYYKETTTDTAPEGLDWELWSPRKVDDQTFYVWRKIDLTENAYLYN